VTLRTLISSSDVYAEHRPVGSSGDSTWARGEPAGEWSPAQSEPDDVRAADAALLSVARCFSRDVAEPASGGAVTFAAPDTGGDDDKTAAVERRYTLRMVVRRRRARANGFTTPRFLADVVDGILDDWGVGALRTLASDARARQWVLRVRVVTGGRNKGGPENVDGKFFYWLNRRLLREGVVRGLRRARAAAGRPVADGEVLDVMGVGLAAVRTVRGVDWLQSVCNNVCEVNELLGIEAAATVMYGELSAVMGHHGSRHILTLVNAMTRGGFVMPVTRHGMRRRTRDCPLALATFEQTPDVIFEAALRGDADPLAGPSENILAGQRAPLGTGFVGGVFMHPSVSGAASAASARSGGTSYQSAGVVVRHDGTGDGGRGDVGGSMGAAAEAAARAGGRIVQTRAVSLGDEFRAPDVQGGGDDEQNESGQAMADVVAWLGDDGCNGLFDDARPQRPAPTDAHEPEPFGGALASEFYPFRAARPQTAGSFVPTSPSPRIVHAMTTTGTVFCPTSPDPDVVAQLEARREQKAGEG
jgi:hypothetical protein